MSDFMFGLYPEVSTEVDDNWCIACHEGAHCAVVESFGGHWRAYIYYDGAQRDWRGSVYYPKDLFSPRQNSVIGWAGSIGSYLSLLSEWEKGSIAGFRRVFKSVLTSGGITQTDLNLIHRYGQPNQTLKAAWRVVLQRRERVVEIALELQARKAACKPAAAALP